MAKSRSRLPPKKANDAEDESDEEEEAEDAPADSTEADLPAFDLADLLYPFSLEEFKQHYWGKQAFSTALDAQVLKRLRAGFWKGDLQMVIPDCRKDDNTRFTSDEASNMEGDLDSGKTLNLPFCFSPSALELKSAVIEQCSGLGNDIEVGVYASRLGGEVTNWHYDNNHNITIQLYGKKDWQHVSGSTSTVGSRGMQEAARNRFEQQRPIPPTGYGDHTCYNLRAGSVIYLPPGHWHQVSTAEGNSRSFSADIRIANVLPSRWICEAISVGLLDRFHTEVTEPCTISPVDFDGGTLSEDVMKQASHASTNMHEMLRRCRLPRWIPFQACHSDGMNLGATLAFLKKKSFISPPLGGLSSVVGVNGLVALGLKRRDGLTLVLQLRSESSLSTMEYLRFSLLCDMALYDAVDLLRTAGKATLRELKGRCTSEASADLFTLLRVLLHANVLYSDPQPNQQVKAIRARPAAAADGNFVQPPVKRVRRRG